MAANLLHVLATCRTLDCSYSYFPCPSHFRTALFPLVQNWISWSFLTVGGRGRGCNSSALITWKLLGPFPPSPPPPTLLMFQDGVLKTASFKPCRETFSSSVKRGSSEGKYRQSTEPEFKNFDWARESIPRNQFHQPMKPGGPVRQPYSDPVLSPHRLF